MSNSFFDKPYRPLPDLVDMLKDERHLLIKDKRSAINLLSLYGYYPLINGYKKPFLETPVNEQYRENSTLEDLYSLFIMDSQFQEIFQQNELNIERHLSNVLGNEVAKNFGVNDHSNNDSDNPDTTVVSYLNSDNYIGDDRNSVIWYIRNKIIPTKEKPTSYYRDDKNHIPPWILVQNMPLGTLARFYKIQQEHIKKSIVNELITPIDDEDMDKKKAIFLSCLEILRKFRNAAAHAAPLYLLKAEQDNCPSRETFINYMGTSIFKDSDPTNLGKSDLYSALLTLFLLTRDERQRAYVLEKINYIRSSYKNVPIKAISNAYDNYLSVSGLPMDFIERLQDAHIELAKHELGKKENTKIDENGNYIKEVVLYRKHPLTNVGAFQDVYLDENNFCHFNKDCQNIPNKEKIQKLSLMSIMDNNSKFCSKCCIFQI